VWSSVSVCVWGNRTYCREQRTRLLGDFRGRGLGRLTCETVFPVVGSFSVDLKSALLLASYETSWVPFGVPSVFFLQGS
jgi:hypothetical protein